MASAVCGTDSAVADAAVRSMLPPMARRGPDAEGLHLWPGVGFGNRRLAILDLSLAGAQPMLSSDGTIGIVFNGCIYNFLEIRDDLEKRGHRFRSQCDTEVLIEGYREWGIWDEPRRTLILSRDRLGVRPMVYCTLKGGIAFASTLGALRGAGFADEIDPRAALEFLDLGFVTEERSIFAGTRKLPPACFLECRDGTAAERRYWTLPEADEASPVTFVRRLGIPHRIVPLDTAQPPPLEELVEANSEPFASTSALGMLRVSCAVKPKAPVLLTGDGGDDVFLGYLFFYNAWKAQKLARVLPAGSPGIWRVAGPIARRFPPLRRAANFLDYAVGGVGAYARVRIGIPYFEARGMFGESLRCGQVAHRHTPSSFDSARRLVADVFAFHSRMHFTSEFMTKVDGGAMYYSLQARSPFLDYALWEFAAQLPPKIHFHGGRLKAVLREIVRRHIGPEVAFRRKQGFAIPVETWLTSQWAGQLKELKGTTLLAEQGWMAPIALSSAVDGALTREEIPKQLWYAVVFEHWLRRQRQSALCASSARQTPRTRMGRE